ncbi:MAG: hypothetical protein LJF06_07655 [Gemmatimonadetes bacterium]|nr:hypothetical protein [Gemmatimonadota bacterium]
MPLQTTLESGVARATTPLPRRAALAVCALVLFSMIFLDRHAALAGGHTAHRALVDSAAALDLTVGASLASWWVLRGDFQWRAWALLPLFFVSLVLAPVALPHGHKDGLRLAHGLAAPLELLSLAFLARRAAAGRRALRRSSSAPDEWDICTALRCGATEAFGPGRFADAIAYEVSVLYYGLFARKRAVSSAAAFTYHRKTAYGTIVLALLMVTAAEVVSVHLLVRLWSPRVAWLLTGVGLYGALWLYGDWRACRLRPVTVDGETLRVRFGLRWQLDIPIDAIRSIRAPTTPERATRGGVDLRLTLPGAPWRVLELNRPVEANGIYGRTRRVSVLGLALDDFDGLSAALEAEGVPVAPSRTSSLEREHG